MIHLANSSAVALPCEIIEEVFDVFCTVEELLELCEDENRFESEETKVLGFSGFSFFADWQKSQSTNFFKAAAAHFQILDKQCEMQQDSFSMCEGVCSLPVDWKALLRGPVET